MSRPIALSDDELDAIMYAARPLAPRDRAAFLQLVAVRLRGLGEIGDGLVARVCRESAREFWRAPELDRDERREGKYA
jgi:hypothetical protein